MNTVQDDAQLLALLLSTNSPPPPAHADYVQARLKELKLKVTKKRLELQVLEEEYNKFVIANSALRRTPPELLGNIFALALPKTLDGDGRQALLNLCLVCRGWREAALQTHRLWNDIRIDGATEAEMSRKKYFTIVLDLHKMGSWLARAGTLPKSVYLGLNQPGPLGGGISVAYPMIAKLIRTLPALDRLTINLPARDRLISLFEQLRELAGDEDPSCLPSIWNSLSVRELELSYGSDTSPSISKGLLLNVIPPSVRNLHFSLGKMSIYDRDPIPKDVVLPPTLIQRLTSLTLTSNWPISDLIPIIRPCTQLEELELDLWRELLVENPVDASSRVLSRIPKLYFPNLRRFGLKRAGARSLAILDILTMPSLEKLEVGFSRGIGDEVDRAYVERFPENLVSLWLGNVEAIRGWEQLLGPWRGCPSLKQLTLDRVLLPYNSKSLSSFWDSYGNLENLEILNIQGPVFDMLKQVSHFIEEEEPEGYYRWARRNEYTPKLKAVPRNPHLKYLKITSAQETRDGKKLTLKEDSEVWDAMLEKIQFLQREGGMEVHIGPQYVQL